MLNFRLDKADKSNTEDEKPQQEFTVCGAFAFFSPQYLHPSLEEEGGRPS